MSEPRADALRQLFERALELSGPARHAYLDRVCGGDQPLRHRLQAMLDAVDDPRFLGMPTQGSPPAAAEPPPPAAPIAGAEGPGSRIGPYRLVRELGEGGFGVVFLAEQDEPVRRLVALKIVKLGMDTRQVVARFEQERQALALMDHPHIAKVLDAGATATGRPYFVMDYVPGQPITAFCDTERLAIPDRLRLFAQICQAVQHAHGKGIIHRDLKPSNVLVTRQDGRPVAKVIDFGIAKATAQRLTDKTVFTAEQQVIGTFQYMSPEQAAGSPDIDTRSDVWSLGVLLYELLTGSTPFDRRTMREAMYSELQRVIREVDPPRPSTRLSESHDALPSIAAVRSVEPRHLGTLLRGDLDWIVMKALEKDRRHRYETASDLAEDVLRHLAGEAVVAAPPSGLYRLRKVVRRHRGAVLAAAAVTTALVAGVIGFAWQAEVAARERNDAVAARNAEALQRTLADERATQLAEVVGFQERMLGQLDAMATGSRLFSDLREAHSAALAASDVDPAAQGELRTTFTRELSRTNATDLATRLVEATFLAPAVAAVQKQFGDQPLVAATLRRSLATIHVRIGRFAEALELAQQALQTHESRLGTHHQETLRSRNDVAHALEKHGHFAQAEPLYRDVVEARREASGPDHPETLAALANLGGNLRFQGKLEAAEAILVEALEASRRLLGPRHRETLIRLNQLGYLRIDQGRATEAEPLWREAYETGIAEFGTDDPDSVTWTNNLAGLQSTLGRPAEAEPIYRQGLDAARRVHGADHPMTWRLMNNLGSTLRTLGRFDEAEALLRDSLERTRHSLGDEHPDTRSNLQGLADLLRARGRPAEAEPMLREAWTTSRRLLGTAHAGTLGLGAAYGTVLLSLGRLAEAEAQLRETLADATGTWPEHHTNRLVALNDLGNVLLQLDRPAEAETVLREAVDLRRRVFGDLHPETLVAQSTFARAREDQGATAEAHGLWVEVHGKFREVLGEGHPHTLISASAAAATLVRLERHAEAEAAYRALLPVAEQVFAGNPLRLAPVHRGLGQALLAQRRFPAAEGSFLASDRLVAGAASASAERKATSCDWLQRLYDAWHAAEPAAGHDAKATTWRDRAAALRAGK